jgi:hypothetical protein
MSDSRPISRRRFLGQASCAAIGSTALFNTLLNLRMAGTAAGQSIGGGNDYRALVCLFLVGWQRFLQHAGPARQRGICRVCGHPARPGPAPGQPAGPESSQQPSANNWACIPTCRRCKTLFEAGRLSFVSNVGTLVERINEDPVRKRQRARCRWACTRTPTRSSSGRPRCPTARWAWAGAGAALICSTALNQNQEISMNISLSGSNVWQAGQQVVEYAITPDGSIGLDGYEGTWNYNHVRGAAIDSQLDLEYRNLFEQTFTQKSRSSIDAHYHFMEAINAAPALTTVFPTDSWLGDQPAHDCRAPSRPAASCWSAPPDVLRLAGRMGSPRRSHRQPAGHAGRR